MPLLHLHLPQDKEHLEIIKEQLLDLKEMEAWEMVRRHLVAQVDRDLRLLEVVVPGEDPTYYRFLQGAIKGKRQAIGALDDIINYINLALKG